LRQFGNVIAIKTQNKRDFAQQKDKKDLLFHVPTRFAILKKPRLSLRSL